MNSHNEIFCYVEWCLWRCPRRLRHVQRYISATKGSWVNITSGVWDCVCSVRVCVLSYASKGHRVVELSKDMRLLRKWNLEMRNGRTTWSNLVCKRYWLHQYRFGFKENV